MNSDSAHFPDPRLRPDERYKEAVVDLGAIAGNLQIVRDRTRVPLMAVVKADAYGHGAVQVARTAVHQGGASWLGVSFTTEALRLREAGIDAPILTFLHLPDEDPALSLRADIDVSVSSRAQLDRVAWCAGRLGRPARIQLNVDTGLHRGGTPAAEWPAFVAAAALLEKEGLVHVRGIWSDHAYPEDPEMTYRLDAFDAAIRQAETAGLAGRMAHIANSAAALAIPRSRYDLIRVGSAMYGIEPVLDHDHGLVPAMTLRGRVIMTDRAVAGDGAASAGHHDRTVRDGGLALVPLGFADGLPLAASGPAEVWIGGARRPLAGSITLTSFIADLGQDVAEPGDEVVVFGSGAAGEPTVADWAAWAGTDPREVLTGVNPRVPRGYAAASDMSPAGGEARLRVAVLFGGPGGEYDVSCASAAVIVGNLDRKRYRVRPVRISPEGRWIPGPADWPAGPCEPRDLLAATPDAAASGGTVGEQLISALSEADVVLPALHGPFGEDGTVQALMDALGVRYVGNAMAASALGMDKDVAKRVAATHGLQVADWVLLRPGEEEVPEEERARLGLPVFVKPARSGSSVGVSRVDTWDEFGVALATARKWDEKVLVERRVVGREVEVALLEYPDGRIAAGPPVEIVVHQDVRDFLDYEAKYHDDTSTDILLPAPLDPQTTAELQRQAVRVFEILGCRGLSRVDFLLRDGVDPVFNEINTFPGFTPTSLYPLMWAEAGLSLPHLLDVMIDRAVASGHHQGSQVPAGS